MSVNRLPARYEWRPLLVLEHDLRISGETPCGWMEMGPMTLESSGTPAGFPCTPPRQSNASDPTPRPDAVICREQPPVQRRFRALDQRTG